MTWYYAEGGKQIGPLTDEQFQTLVQLGTIRGDNLVWRQGMTGWLPYSNVSAAAASSAAAPESLPPVATTTVCAECRLPFPPEQMIRFGDAFVCANCKPVYLQKLREGVMAAPSQALRYGGFWIRVLAKMIDSIIVGVPVFLLFMVGGFYGGFGLATPQGPMGPGAILAMLGLQMALQLVGIVISGLYTVYFLVKYAATPGKMVCGLKVVNANGAELTVGKAIGRFFAEILSGFTCYIGYLIAAFDDEKRTLHDHLCGTRVVFK